jgi:SAM-dependent methyltransferase
MTGTGSAGQAGRVSEPHLPGPVARRRRRAFPELAAGGFSRVDGTVEFHQRVDALCTPDSVVVEFGAGRGQFLEDALPFRRDLQNRRGRAHRVIGLDVDPVVRHNPALDEAHVISTGAALPLADASVDLVVADHVFEHIEDPAWASRELDRVLRPGGWICARTPNRWGAIAVPARLVPNRWHDAVLARVQPDKQSRDTFPTQYRLNTPAALRRWFPPERFDHCSYTHESEPAYVGRSSSAWSLIRGLAAITPPPLRSIHLVFLRKRADAS